MLGLGCRHELEHSEYPDGASPVRRPRRGGDVPLFSPADWFALALFVSAAATDYFDGYLARLWKQESKFGAMLDPIADKAMVVIAIMILTGYNGMNPLLILPATVILFREVFVSGLREFLGPKVWAACVDRRGP